MKVYIYLIFAGMLISCSRPGVFENEIATVDSLTLVIDTLDVRMDSVGHEALQEDYEEVQQLYSYLLANFSDSADRSFWIKDVNAMRRVKRSLETYEQQYQQIRKQISYTREQLSGLKNSLADEKISAEQAEQYISDETRAVSEVTFLVNKVQPAAVSAVAIWDTLYPQMQATADSIEKAE